MRNLFIALFALSIPAMAVATNGDEKTTYTVDASKSTITWKGYKVTGEHAGTINITEGTVMMDGDKLTGGEFTIDMTSIAVTDLSGDSQGKLEGHLKSDDFFGVQSFPTATLKITKLKSKVEGYEVKGDLTIKGITEPVDFTAKVMEKDGMIHAMSDIKVDRSKYNVRYGSNSFFDNLGDKAIYDEFDLTINLVLGSANS